MAAAARAMKTLASCMMVFAGGCGWGDGMNVQMRFGMREVVGALVVCLLRSDARPGVKKDGTSFYISQTSARVVYIVSAMSLRMA